MPRLAFLALGILALTGCARRPSLAEQQLNVLLARCTEGDRQACGAIPMYQNQVALETRIRAQNTRDMLTAMQIGAAAGSLGRPSSGREIECTTDSYIPSVTTTRCR